MDLLAVAPDQGAADELAEALPGAVLADDVIGLSQGGAKCPWGFALGGLDGGLTREEPVMGQHLD